MALIHRPELRNEIVTLSSVCERYAQPPHTYLFNDDLIDCASTRFAIDRAVHTVHCRYDREQMKKEKKKIATIKI